MSSSIPTDFEIKTVSEQDREKIMEHMNLFFSKDEPLCQNFKHLREGDLFYQDFNNFIDELLRNPTHSLVIFHNGKLIGAALNEVYERNHSAQFTDVPIKSREFEHICNIFENAKEQSKLFEKFPDCNKILLLKMLSVDSSYRGKGLAKLLVDKSRELAKKLGCEVLTADCSSDYSSKAFARLGFELVYSLPYSSYKVDGQEIFNNVQPHVGINIYAQRL